jgi:hypothetical protein
LRPNDRRPLAPPSRPLLTPETRAARLEPGSRQARDAPHTRLPTQSVAQESHAKLKNTRNASTPNAR